MAEPQPELESDEQPQYTTTVHKPFDGTRLYKPEPEPEPESHGPRTESDLKMANARADEIRAAQALERERKSKIQHIIDVVDISYGRKQFGL